MVAKFIKGVKSTVKTFQHFECLEMKMRCYEKNILVYLIYRPPNYVTTDFLAEFESFLFESETSTEKVLYVGDFNVWVEDSMNDIVKKFTDVLDNFNLKNHVTTPTYDSGHILDLVITNKDSELVSGLCVEPVCTISDHRLVTFDVGMNVERVYGETITFRNMKNIDYELLNNKILNVCSQDGQLSPCANLSYNSDSQCIDCLVNTYKNETVKFFHTHAPLIEKNIKIKDSNRTWYNSEISLMKKKVRKAEKNFKKFKTDLYREEFKRLKQIKCDLVTNTKSSYYKKKINDCGSDYKKLYSHLNKLLGKKNKEYTLPQTYSGKILADKFKTFFTEKVDIINREFETNTNPLHYTNILAPEFPLKQFDSFASVTPSHVIFLLKKANKTNCLNDPFNVKLIEFDKILEPLACTYADLINCSFRTGLFPESEKFAIIRPKIKGTQDVDDLASYRPLYNTSFLSKILESAALTQLISHVSKFEYFPKVQSAYRAFHSVETALCKIHNDLIINKCKGHCSLIVMLDLSAAFDTVDHGLLLQDLRSIGLSGRVYKWFVSYLTNREFKVAVGEDLSEAGIMKTGIPQGSILGPILFIIYTAELQYLLDSLNVSYHFYADDT